MGYLSDIQIGLTLACFGLDISHMAKYASFSIFDISIISAYCGESINKDTLVLERFCRISVDEDNYHVALKVIN